MSYDQKISWYRTPVEKETLAKLREKKNLLPLLHALSQISISVITGLAVYLAWRYLAWPFWIIALYIHCTLITFLSPTAIIHELSHRTVFKSRFLNELFIMICSFLTWTNYVKFRVSHIQHHQYTVHKDLDLEVTLPEIIRPIDWFFYLTIPIYSMQNVDSPFKVFEELIRHAFALIQGKQDEILFPKENKKLRSQLFNWARFTLIAHIILAGIFIYYDLWILLLIVTFARFIAPWLGLACTLPQHLGMKPNTPDFRVCCRSMLLSPFYRFFYWNMHYHVEHHMYAAVPYHNLPKLNQAIKHDLPKPKAGMWNNWKDLFPVIKRQRTEPDYSITVELPTQTT